MRQQEYIASCCEIFLGTNIYRQQQFGDKRDEPHKTARDMPPKKPGCGHLFKADKTNKTTRSPPTEPTRSPVSGLKEIRD